MCHAYFHLNQICNVPNNPYYVDSRVLKVIIFPPNQIQTILLSGLDVLTTNQEFYFQFQDTPSNLSVVLMETKPHPFDLAYITIPINSFPLNAVVNRKFKMQLLISGIENPEISFNFHLTSLPQPFTRKNSLIANHEKENNSQDSTFILNDTSPMFNTAPSNDQITNNQYFQPSLADTEAFDSSEEEDLIINSRIIFQRAFSLKSSTSFPEHQSLQNTKGYLQQPPVMLSPQQFNQVYAIPQNPPDFVHKQYNNP